jgi:hypothetical protein
MGIINVDFDAAGQLLIIYSAFVKYLIKIGNTMKQRNSYLYTSGGLMTHLEGGSSIILSFSSVSR